MKLFRTLACSLLLPVAAIAAIDVNIYVSVPDGLYFESDGATRVDDSYTLDWGVLSISFADFTNLTPQEQIAYLADIDTNFTSLGSFQFNSDGTLEQEPAYRGDVPVGTSPGDQLYTLVKNALGTQLGLFTATGTAFWTMPASPGEANLFLEAGTPTALIGSTSGVNGILADQVPEPSTYAFLAGVMTLGLVAYRRRQKI
ncbi:PEP-CTERM sorting domain-containing protein [Cerasicoccus arenae]|uniref:PEP-CTERM protein-sorting domain-containing protein n=1 Tax=Cerasicoccus arenae TaxID=424488 RepID=A0A8J3DB27_9BACT|nr:PEP-CTERM sorting domain-containing protein [Cerasicoccus arenae]MBK1857972.1 PEP-CTERM sorting domain-containing protein [Cerasicoccus arenae]GHB97742.1 hypothetical protein GCM10007047_12010 [Cerasicoccus arenae]